MKKSKLKSGKKIRYSGITFFLLSISFILLIIILIYSSISYALLYISSLLILILISYFSSIILDFFRDKSISMLIYDYHFSFSCCFGRIWRVFWYYTIFTFIVFLSLKISVINLFPSLTDDIGLMLFASLLAYLPRMSYSLKNYDYSKKIIFSIIAPLSVINVIYFLYDYHQNGTINLNIDFIYHIPGASLIIFSLIAVFYGDLFIWFFKEKVFSIKLQFYNIDDLFTQIREQNSALLPHLFHEWEKSDGDKKLMLEKGIDYAYRVALEGIPVLIIMGDNGTWPNTEMRSSFERAINNVNYLSVRLDAIKFKWIIYMHNKKYNFNVHDYDYYIEKSIIDYAYEYNKQRNHAYSLEDFNIALIKSLIEDFIHSKGDAKYYATKIIKELDEIYFDINQYGLSPMEYKLYQKIKNC